MHTRVGIVGAGPAGLLLARLLHLAGIDCVVLESRDREYVQQRQRAGILEQGTVDVLREIGAGARLDREGMPHEGIELLFGGRGHRIDLTDLTGGRRVWIYAQTEVVKDLIALHLADGPPLLFEAEVHAVTDLDRPVIHYTHAGRAQVLACDYVVGCDGFHGVVRHSIPAGAARVHERAFPYSWMGILAEAPPLHHELVYAHTERGFALASMRSPSVSRLYLQVPNGTEPWADDEIWAELDRRLGTSEHWPNRGPITAKSVLPMRASVTEPMRFGQVFLAGDAAHIVPPTGAKGLNLAVADVVTLGRAFASGSAELLDAYSDTCLRRVWRAEHFSNLMTSMLHLAPGQSSFETRLQVSWLEYVVGSRAAGVSLAENYTGLG
ncbi:4-hydroxybenzoate 3-monooxygenase [Actinokineospora sp. NBRC 105648]|uniref:4-hydroxybenzoate 3-monooxygenase n=1 Tax=Actinokineospora sp. NBRC 105648 TaxID=3032206 RepID=UPI0024A43737|nr:4-hydroxybenzoate 3-monooxygenase [Actinokineospora sp. NBRC 105648]GLZ40849.1 4-hydroxybenzoate 3-monooxygenase [Actinokineospora sp. NBRC 105648]